ncbi:MAG: glycosyltransferase [Clostridia bacterium]|nr:glycosyltransferase [Clostridia bacterium]
MKVLQINTVCGILSTGRICTDLAEVLEQNGHECKIAYGRMNVPGKYQRYAIRIGNDTNVMMDVLKTRVFDNAGFNSVSATKKFLKWVEGYDPDIIHLHNIHGYYINIELLFKFLKDFGKPVVWTLHDCWSFTGHCSHFVAAQCDKWKENCVGCTRKRVYPSSLFLNRAAQNFRKKKELLCGVENLTIVTPSNWLGNLVKQSYLKDYQLAVVNNGIDLEVFKPTNSDFRKKHGLEDKKIVLGVASAWGKNKGLDEFAALSESLGDEYKVVIVGIKQEQAVGLPKEILCIPRTHDVKELAEIYTAADVFLNPSRQETMGLTTVEAMACGTPVVTSNLTAVPEVVDERTGIVCENLEIDTIKSAILEVLSRDYPDTRARAEEYEKSAQYRKYISVYESLFKE